MKTTKQLGNLVTGASSQRQDVIRSPRGEESLEEEKKELEIKQDISTLSIKGRGFVIEGKEIGACADQFDDRILEIASNVIASADPFTSSAAETDFGGFYLDYCTMFMEAVGFQVAQVKNLTGIKIIVSDEPHAMPVNMFPWGEQTHISGVYSNAGENMGASHCGNDFEDCDLKCDDPTTRGRLGWVGNCLYEYTPEDLLKFTLRKCNKTVIGFIPGVHSRCEDCAEYFTQQDSVTGRIFKYAWQFDWYRAKYDWLELDDIEYGDIVSLDLNYQDRDYCLQISPLISGQERNVLLQIRVIIDVTREIKEEEPILIKHQPRANGNTNMKLAHPKSSKPPKVDTTSRMRSRMVGKGVSEALEIVGGGTIMVGGSNVEVQQLKSKVANDPEIKVSEIKIELQRQKNDRIVICPWVLAQTTTSRNYVWEIVWRDVGYGAKWCVNITGNWKVGDESTRTTGTFELWDTVTQKMMTNCSDDGIFGRVKDNDCYTHRAALEYLVGVDARRRLQMIMKSLLPKYFDKFCYGHATFVRDVRAAYRRFYADFPSLDKLTYDLMTSIWWRNELSVYCHTERKRHIVESRMFLNSLAANMGQDELYVKLLVNRGIFWRKFKYWINPINVARVVMRWEKPPMFEQEVINDLIVRSSPAYKNSILPVVAARLYLRRVMVPDEREPKPIWDGHVKLTVDPGVENIEDSDIFVAVYGSTINIPVLLPHLNDKNLLYGLKERVFFDREIDKEVESDFEQYAKKLIDDLNPFEIEPVTKDETLLFLQQQYGNKMADDFISYYEDELTDHDFDITYFTKNESYVGKDETDFKPRMIGSYKPIIIAKFGLQFHRLGKLMKQRFNKNTHAYYCSSATPDEVGSYASMLAQDFNTLFEFDISNFDGSLSEVMLRLEYYFITTKVFGWSPEFTEMLRRWYERHGYSKGDFFKFIIEFARVSGHLNTSPFNSLINLLLAHWSLKTDWTNKDVAIMVLGDDGMGGTNLVVDVNKIIKQYAGLGMTLKISCPETLWDAGFCSGMFLPVMGQVRWTNSPKIIAKLGINYNSWNEKFFKELLYGTLRGFGPTAYHLPIIGAFLRALADSAKAKNYKPKYDNRHLNPYRFQGGVVVYPQMDTYAACERRWGIPIKAMMELEEYFEHCVDIDDCPYLFVDSVIRDIVLQEVGCEDRNNNTLFADKKQTSDYNQVVHIIPMEEEIEKLRGVESLAEAVQSGWNFGEAEDSEFGITGHSLLHAVFSGLSYMNLMWGVGAHSTYNRWAYLRSGIPCANKKAKPQKKKFKQPKKSGAQKRKKPKPKKKRTFTSIGERAGGMIGPLAARAGGALGAGIDYILDGTGDYKLRRNSLMRGNMPHFQLVNRTGGLRFSYREYLGDVLTSAVFVNSSYSLNPGLIESFPFLAMIASCFNEYMFHGLVFYFKSTSGTALNSTNAAQGTIVMSTQMNPDRPAFINKNEQETSQFSVSFKPGEDCFHAVECNPTDRPMKTMFLRDGIVPNNSLLAYDLGVFQISTQGSQAVYTAGELWVAYDVEFFYPRSQPNPYENASWFYNNTAYTNGSPLGTGTATEAGDLAEYVTITGTIITIDGRISNGRFVLDVLWNGTSTAVTVANCVVSSTITKISYNNFPETIFPNAGATVSRCGYRLYFDIVNSGGSNCTLNFASGYTLPTSGNGVWITLMGIPETTTEF